MLAETRQTLQAKFDSALEKFQSFLERIYSFTNLNESRIKEINKLLEYLDNGISSAKKSIKNDHNYLYSCGFTSLDENLLDIFSSHVLSIKQVKLFSLL
jgi:hypothetical protein